MLSMEDVPALPADVRLRVLATALDPNTPPAPDTLVPADTVDLAPAEDTTPWPDLPEPEPDPAPDVPGLDVPDLPGRDGDHLPSPDAGHLAGPDDDLW